MMDERQVAVLLLLLVGITAGFDSSKQRGRFDRDDYSTHQLSSPDYEEQPHRLQQHSDSLVTSQPSSHTFPNRTQCAQLCQTACHSTSVYFGKQITEMFTCNYLRPPPKSMLAGVSKWTAAGISAVVGVLLLALALIICCCCECCRTSHSSSSSSKEGLHDGSNSNRLHHHALPDNDFKEYIEKPSTSARRELLGGSSNGCNGNGAVVRSNGGFPTPRPLNGHGPHISSVPQLV